jgi:hypothetical protein
MNRPHALDDRLSSRPYFVNMCFSDPAVDVEPTPYALKGEEQRRSRRRRVLLSALVVHQDFRISFKCAIRDVSENGARLKAPPGCLVPASFLLIDIVGGRGYEATTAWRRYPHIGVSVNNAMDLREPAAKLALRLRTLWLGHIH